MDEADAIGDSTFLTTLKQLSQAVQVLPSDPSQAANRRELLMSSERDLLRYGLDPEGFVRYGLGRTLARVIAVWIMLVSRPESSEFRCDLADGGANLLRWAELTDHVSDPAPDSDSEPELPLDELSRLSRIVHRWVLNAPYEDLIEWSPPTGEELLRMAGPGEASAALCESYVWLSDRFLNDELAHWESASLVNEYKWLKSLVPNPCPESLMRVVTHDVGEVSLQLAELHVFGGDDGERKLLADIQRQSLDLLQQSRYLEAAMLFEFYSRRHPGDPLSINNRGFCLIPLDPASAHRLLEEAKRRGYGACAINVYNQMLCLRRIAREGEALDLAEDYWQRSLEPGPVSGVIWNHSSSKYEIIDATDVRKFIIALAAELCEALGLSSRVDAWGDRLDGLGA
jgi:hypothetical protein